MSHRKITPIDDPLANLPTPAGSSEERFAAISRMILQTSPHVRSSQFREIATTDLEYLFELYDRVAFGGLLTRLIVQAQVPPVRFRLSQRMTSAAGKTTQRRTRTRHGGRIVERVEYEIAISSFLLFEAFRDERTSARRPQRAVEVAGVTCVNRLEALLRIFEHELLHLAEFLATGRSNCAGERFRQLSRQLFGHEASVHTLITPVEQAAVEHSISRGDRVAFTHAGVEHTGHVNRVTRRATVLVPDVRGALFSDGSRYLKFLVPLDRLRKL